MECLANTSSFDHACFKIDGFSFKKHSTKVGPRHSTPPQFLFECAPLIVTSQFDNDWAHNLLILQSNNDQNTAEILEVHCLIRKKKQKRNENVYKRPQY